MNESEACPSNFWLMRFLSKVFLKLTTCWVVKYQWWFFIAPQFNSSEGKYFSRPSFSNYCHHHRDSVSQLNDRSSRIAICFFKNLAEVEHIRHNLPILQLSHISDKTCQTLSDQKLLTVSYFSCKMLTVRMILASFVDASCQTMSEKWTKFQQVIIWNVLKVLRLFLQFWKNQIIIQQFYLWQFFNTTIVNTTERLNSFSPVSIRWILLKNTCLYLSF